MESELLDRKLNIAFVSREYPPSKRLGGIATYVSDTATSLAENGHMVHVIAASDDIHKTEEYIEKKVHVIRLSGSDFYIGKTASILNKIYSRWRRIFCYKSYRSKLADCLSYLVKEHGVEIVEFAEYGNESLIWAKKKRYVPMIIRLHGSAFLNRATGRQISFKQAPLAWWFGRAEITGLQQADAISSCSSNLAELEANFAQIAPETICVIPNAVKFKDMQFKKESSDCKYHYFFPSAQYNIFSAGSVVEGKGFGDLVKAVAILRKGGMDISVTIAGKLGKLGRKLTKQSTNGDNPHTWLKLLGQISRKELPQLYATADIVVFPSWWEPLGIVLLEAMTAGGLTIGSSAGGMKEVIKEGENGFLIAPQNPASLAKKIQQVLLLPTEKKKAIRIQAINTVKNNYNTSIIMDQQIKLYRSTLNKFKLEK